MQPILCILALLGLAFAAPTKNYNATTPPTGTNTATITHASILSSSSSTSSSTPSSTHCPILIENHPWLLTNITHFVPSLPSQNHSNSTSSSSSSPSSAFISFHFRDTNQGLELETRCFRTLPKRSETNPGTYFPCEDGRVRFAYVAGEELKVGRVHRDDW
ncbi:hypothetical protein KC354_g1595 [Hortaea werneckii]|nr:hypothetical protein KC354_g1595 [Hortaea werneckii]